MLPEEHGPAPEDADVAEDTADDGEDEELDVEDLAESNQVLISAVIELLIRKGLLTQEEIDAEVESIQAEEDEGEESPEEASPEQPWQQETTNNNF